jgi:ketopantoate reductase
MLNTIVGAGAVGAGTGARLLAAPAPQHCNVHCTVIRHTIDKILRKFLVRRSFQKIGKKYAYILL